MELAEFELVKSSFVSADIEDKIDIYISTENLSKDQYRELLKMYPVSELHRLEEALQ